MTAKYITAVVDLQYGSTGKGQIAGTVAQHWKPETVCTAFGPNAGHTFRDGELQTVSRMLATSAICPSVKNILIGPGSVVDLELLADEIIDRGRRHLEGKHLIIHSQAVLWDDKDAEAEKVLVRIGSTMKGTAAAHIRKIRREIDAVAGKNTRDVVDIVGRACFEAGMSIVVSSYHYDQVVDNSQKILVEGAQGFSLGYHTDFYPHCTGRDVSTAQLFADCRLPWVGHNVWPRVHVIGVCRTYPIRVNNRTYSSGGHYPDQEEITWESLGRKAELTTVTQLPRRVFTFSHEQIRQAVRVCAPTTLALTFCDYLAQEVDPLGFANDIASKVQVPVRIMSFGPDTSDVKRRVLNGLQPLLETECDYLGGVTDHGY